MRKLCIRLFERNKDQKIVNQAIKLIKAIEKSDKSCFKEDSEFKRFGYVVLWIFNDEIKIEGPSDDKFWRVFGEMPN